MHANSLRLKFKIMRRNVSLFLCVAEYGGVA